MSRHEGDFQAAAEAALDLGELAKVLGRLAPDGSRERQEAIACALSASTGWRDAATRLGGAFDTGSPGAGLTAGKEK